MKSVLKYFQTSSLADALPSEALVVNVIIATTSHVIVVVNTQWIRFIFGQLMTAMIATFQARKKKLSNCN